MHGLQKRIFFYEPKKEPENPAHKVVQRLLKPFSIRPKYYPCPAAIVLPGWWLWIWDAQAGN